MKYLYQTKWPQWIRRGRGFSFTEVITAVGIMGLLAAVATPMYLEYKHDSLINRMKTDSGAVRNKIAMCFKYAELHDCDDGNCDHTERLNARWETCYPSTDSNAGRMKKLGLIPCWGGSMSLSTACDHLRGNASSKLLCVTLKWKEQQACVRYEAPNNKFTVCVDPEDPGSCHTGCDPEKGYTCNSSLQCVCA